MNPAPRFAIGLAACLIAAGSAEAADYLRGTIAHQPVAAAESFDWAGIYAGIHGGYGNTRIEQTNLRDDLANAGFANLAITSQIANIVPLGARNKDAFAYGVFAGINMQWDDVVLGLEADYTRGEFKSSTGGSINRVLTEGTQWDTRVDANVRTRVLDYGTIRARAGWAFGRYLPFATLGVAIANVNTRGVITGTTQQFEEQPVTDAGGNVVGFTRINRSVVLPVSADLKNNGLDYGLAVGLGMDVMLFQNAFLRAEWQYVQFGSGKSEDVTLNTARVGIAAKF